LALRGVQAPKDPRAPKGQWAPTFSRAPMVFKALKGSQAPKKLGPP
jgi:hypothetical protein